MVADISTPDHELKTAICLLKAKRRGFEISNSLASAIADSVDNIRTLEGSLQQIISKAAVEKQPITLEFVQKHLGLPTASIAKLDARLILDAVCAYYELPIKLIKGEKRDKPIAVPRQVLMYLLKTNTAMTLTEIGDFLGGRDHTTIMHGTDKIEALLQTDQRTREDVEMLGKNLRDKVHM